MDASEREIESLDNDLANGDIDIKEYSRNVRDMEHDYRESARESAQNAYEREMERW
jgi:predicted  nucleic acid-binding Zn-ribbon protein